MNKLSALKEFFGLSTLQVGKVLGHSRYVTNNYLQNEDEMDDCSREKVDSIYETLNDSCLLGKDVVHPIFVRNPIFVSEHEDLTLFRVLCDYDCSDISKDLLIKFTKRAVKRSRKHNIKKPTISSKFEKGDYLRMCQNEVLQYIDDL